MFHRNELANRPMIASLRGFEAIIKAMSTHFRCAIVQEHACGALWNLAVNDGIPIWSDVPVFFLSNPFYGCRRFCSWFRSFSSFFPPDNMHVSRCDTSCLSC